MPRMHFTVRSIQSLKSPTSGQIDFWDTGLAGFGLRVSAGGTKTWTIMYRHGNRKRRLKLGTHPTMKLPDARAKAKAALREVEDGKDPASIKQSEKRAETFSELAGEFIERHAKKRKRTWRTDERILKKDIRPEIGSLKAKEVSRADIRRLIDKIAARGAGIQANRTHALLSKIFNWGISVDLVDSNPCRGVVKPGVEKQRERVLADDEIRAVWGACAGEPSVFGKMVQLRLLTAQRGGEIKQMRWPDIDGDWWTIPGEHTKNRLAHRVPLSPLACAILDSIGDRSSTTGLVFPSSKRDGPLGKNWRVDVGIRTRSGVDFVFHDLRRTAASRLTGDLGISRLTVQKVLNHVEPGVTAVYDRHSYDGEKRAALDAWAARLEEIVSGESPPAEKVVRLHSS